MHQPGFSAHNIWLRKPQTINNKTYMRAIINHMINDRLPVEISLWYIRINLLSKMFRMSYFSRGTISSPQQLILIRGNSEAISEAQILRQAVLVASRGQNMELADMHLQRRKEQQTAKLEFCFSSCRKTSGTSSTRQRFLFPNPSRENTFYS